MDGDEEEDSCQRIRSDLMFVILLLLVLCFSNVSLKRRLFKKHHNHSEIEIPVTRWVVELLIKADLFFLGWGELSDVREVTALNLK